MAEEDDMPIPIIGRKPVAPSSHWYGHADEVLCICYQLPASTIIDAIRKGRRSIPEIAQECMAGGACGSCRMDILEILDDEEAGVAGGADATSRASLPIKGFIKE